MINESIAIAILLISFFGFIAFRMPEMCIRDSTNSLSDYGFRKLNMFGLPFIFTDRESMWEVLEHEELGQAFLTEGAEAGAGMVGVFYMDEGARNMFTTKTIGGLGDIRDMKIRVPETELMMDTMKALGAQPTPISYSELYLSLIHI